MRLYPSRHPVMRVFCAITLLCFAPSAIGADFVTPLITRPNEDLARHAADTGLLLPPALLDSLAQSQVGAEDGEAQLQMAKVDRSESSLLNDETLRAETRAEEAQTVNLDGLRQLGGGKESAVESVNPANSNGSQAPSYVSLDQLSKQDALRNTHLAKSYVVRKQSRGRSATTSAAGQASQEDAAAAEDVDLGDAALAARDYPSAVQHFVRALAASPHSSAGKTADARMRRILQEAQTRVIDSEVLSRIERQIPAWEELRTPEAKHALVTVISAAAEAFQREGVVESARDYHESAMALASKLIAEHAAAPVNISTVNHYMASANGLDRTTLSDALRWFITETRNSDSQLLDFQLRAIGSYVLVNAQNDIMNAYLMAGDLVADAESGLLDAILEDPNEYDWVKAQYMYAVALARHSIGNRHKALEDLELLLAEFPDAGVISAQAALSRATVLGEIYRTKPELGIAAFQDFLQAYPDSPFIDRALWSMGNIYFHAELYQHADAAYQMVTTNFPDSSYAPSCQHNRQYLEQYILYSESGLVPPEDAPQLDLPQLAKACGPEALNHLLARQGIFTTTRELIALVEEGDSGASLLSLQRAASAKGLDAVGVKADTPGGISVPFLAFVDENHYVTVVEVSGDRVGYIDGPKGYQEISASAFSEKWSGYALVMKDAAEGLVLASHAEASSVVGAQIYNWSYSVPPACPNGRGKEEDCPVPPKDNGVPQGRGDGPPDPCNRKGGDGDGQGTVGAPGTRLGGGGSANGGGANSFDSGFGVVGSGITAPEIDFFIIGRQGAQFIEQSDIFVPSRGDLALEFSRTFFNRWGGTPAESGQWGGFGQEPYGNNIGQGWSHNYNIVLAETTNTVAPNNIPYGVAIMQHRAIKYYQSTSQSTFDGTDYFDEYVIDPRMDSGTGNDVYPYTGGALTSELSEVVWRNRTTGAYALHYETGAKLHFRVPGGTALVGQLAAIEDRYGNQVELTYNQDDQLTRVDAPTGDPRYLELEWNGSSCGEGSHPRISAVRLMKTGVTDPLREIEYCYVDGGLNLGTVSYPDESTNKFTYETGLIQGTNDIYAFYIDGFKDKTDSWTTFACTYLESQLQAGWYTVFNIEIFHPHGLTSQHERAHTGPEDYTITQWDESTDEELSRIRLTTDGSAYHNKAERLYGDASGSSLRQWSYGYDSTTHYRDLTYVTDPSGLATYSFNYNSQGNITSLKRYFFSGDDLEFYYDSSGKYPTKRVDPNGAESVYEYDSAMRLTRYYHPSMGTGDVTYEYGSNGELTKVTDPLNHDWEYAYDTMGNLTSVTDPLLNETTMAYDDFGHVTKVTDPLLKETTYEYASQSGCSCGAATGRLTKIVDHNSNETSFEYNTSGQVTKVTDSLSQTMGYEYNAMHRLTAVAMPHGSSNKVTYEYDLLGRISTVIGLDGEAVTYHYSFMGDLTRIADPEGDVQFAYWPNGNVSQMIDGNGHATNFYYWNAGGLAKTVDSEGKVVRYWYDAMGNLTKTGAGADGDIDPITYSYNSGSATSTGLLDSVAYQNGTATHTVSYDFDDGGRLSNVDDWLGDSSNQGQFFAYDAANRLTLYTDFDGATLSYQYDAAGNITSRTDFESNVTSYVYDNLHRLSTLTAPGSKTWTFDYNALGQMTTLQHPNSMNTVYGYDALHRLSTLTQQDTVASSSAHAWQYTLSDGGNILRMADAAKGSQAWDYTYDGRGRLVRALYNNADGEATYSHAYRYDKGDNRLQKAKLVYDGGVSDDFNDADYTANPTWTPNGTWSVVNQALVNTTSGSWQDVRINLEQEDAEYRFRYNIDDATVSQARARAVLRASSAGTERLNVVFYAGQIVVNEVKNGNWRSLVADASVSTESDVWYEVYIRLIGSQMEVYRAADGEGMELVASCETSVLAGESVWLEAGPNTVVRYDDFEARQVRPLHSGIYDNFTDGNLTAGPAWSATGSWSIVNGAAHNANSGTWEELTQDIDNSDGELRFSYRRTSGGGRLAFNTRYDPATGDRINILFFADKLRMRCLQGGSGVNIITDDYTVTTELNTWYDVLIRSEGNRIAIYRAKQDEAMAQIAVTELATVLSGPSLTYQVEPGSEFDVDHVSLRLAGVEKRSFTDDFANGHGDWTISNGTWDSSAGYMRNVLQSSGYPNFKRFIDFKDFTLDFSIYREDSNASNFEFRDAANRRFLVSFESSQVRLREHDGTAWTTPDTNSYVLTPGQWYDVKVVADGGYIEVWAGPQGQAPEKLLETATTVVEDRKQIIFVSSPNSNVCYDNVALSVPDPEIAAYAYNDANELEKAVEDGVATHYTYDAWGRTSSRYQGDGSAIYANYVYRFGDKVKLLTSTFQGEAATMAYNYDGLGRRRNAWEGYPNGEPTWYRWEGWQELGSYADGTGDWDIGDIERYYLPGLGEVAEDEPGGQNAEWRYYLTDHLGSVRGILGGGRETLARYAYTPYGETALEAGLPLHVGFTGHLWEPQTGQYFTPFRYYSPGNGRWLTRDPLGYVDGPNVYGYVGGNPVLFVDELGLTLAAGPLLNCDRPYAGDMPAAGSFGAGIAIGVLIGSAVDGIKNIFSKPSKGGGRKPKNDLGDEIRERLQQPDGKRGTKPDGRPESPQEWADRLFPETKRTPNSPNNKFKKWCEQQDRNNRRR